jgi:hypothetical protein
LQLAVLEWIQHAGNFSDESETSSESGFSQAFGKMKKRFEPKYPRSKEDLLALMSLRLNDCRVSGNQRRERQTRPFGF